MLVGSCPHTARGYGGEREGNRWNLRFPSVPGPFPRIAIYGVWGHDPNPHQQKAITKYIKPITATNPINYPNYLRFPRLSYIP